MGSCTSSCTSRAIAHIDKIGPQLPAQRHRVGRHRRPSWPRASEWIVKLAGIGLAVGTIVAFILSRQGDGLFDFREEGLEPSPQAPIALIVEIAAIVLLADRVVPSVAAGDESSGVPILGGSAAVSAIALIGLGVYWSSDYGDSPSVAVDAGHGRGRSSISPSPRPRLTVTPGSTITWTNADRSRAQRRRRRPQLPQRGPRSGRHVRVHLRDSGEFAYICGIHPSMAGTVIVAAD